MKQICRENKFVESDPSYRVFEILLYKQAPFTKPNAFSTCYPLLTIPTNCGPQFYLEIQVNFYFLNLNF